MKTTVDIADPLLDEARKIASREGITVKALIELGLRKVIEQKRSTQEFQLRKASFKGKGLQPEMQGVSWDRMRERAYEGHGT